MTCFSDTLWFSVSESQTTTILLNTTTFWSEQTFGTCGLMSQTAEVCGIDRCTPLTGSNPEKLTLAVSVLSVTMYMKLRLTRSGPLQMQMMRPSRSASLFPAASRDARIFGSFGNTNALVPVQFMLKHWMTYNNLRTRSARDRRDRIYMETPFVCLRHHRVKSTESQRDAAFPDSHACVRFMYRDSSLKNEWILSSSCYKPTQVSFFCRRTFIMKRR